MLKTEGGQVNAFLRRHSARPKRWGGDLPPPRGPGPGGPSGSDGRGLLLPKAQQVNVCADERARLGATQGIGMVAHGPLLADDLFGEFSHGFCLSVRCRRGRAAVVLAASALPVTVELRSRIGEGGHDREAKVEGLDVPGGLSIRMGSRRICARRGPQGREGRGDRVPGLPGLRQRADRRSARCLPSGRPGILPGLAWRDGSTPRGWPWKC